ncbi:transporter [Pseudomonas asuensis]
MIRKKASGLVSIKVSVSLTFFCNCGIIHATDLPAVNLGLTSFYDGAPVPGGPGWTGSIFYTHYDAKRITDNKGNKVSIPKSTTQIDTTALQLIYQGTGGPLESDWGVSALLPILISAKVEDGLRNSVLNANDGVADLSLGLYLQSKPIVRDGKIVFSQRVEADISLPTGRYSKNYAINPGSNFFSFNPYWAATYWMTPKVSISWRAHYLWNAKNSNPSLKSYDSGISEVQAGQAIHFNYNILYALNNKFQVGINGYWLSQFTDTKLNGNSVSGRRERIQGIGPGFMYGFSKEIFW